MTTEEAADTLRSVYQWAWGVQHNSKSGSVLLLCALRVCAILERHDKPEASMEAYQELQKCLQDWRSQLEKSKSGTLRLAIDSLSLMLGSE